MSLANAVWTVYAVATKMVNRAIAKAVVATKPPIKWELTSAPIFMSVFLCLFAGCTHQPQLRICTGELQFTPRGQWQILGHF